MRCPESACPRIQPGDTIASFDLQESRPMPWLRLTAVLPVLVTSGALAQAPAPAPAPSPVESAPLAELNYLKLPWTGPTGRGFGFGIEEGGWSGAFGSGVRAKAAFT